ncbi:MAG TPA: redoxin domain-containing protein, partial [Candidatus Berkiella sp.]|nr:redoxin domain-containing protein [Candidatus Berkiella sp.]
RLLQDAKVLEANDIGCVAISSNEPTDYPEDSYENMQKIARTMEFSFPYLFDASQAVAKAYGAVCTPDFFGYNANLELRYRGRLDESGIKPAASNAKRELVEAMLMIAKTG